MKWNSTDEEVLNEQSKLLSCLKTSQGSAYDKTLKLLKSYKDLEQGKILTKEERYLLDLINECFNILENDADIGILDLNIRQGERMEVVAEKMNIEVRHCFRKRRILVKRMSVLIFGDGALSEILSK